MNTIDFVRKTLEELGIHTFILNEPFQWDSMFDNALREHILTSQDEIEAQWTVTIPDICQKNILATISDSFNCEYVCIRLPDPDRLSVLFVGPFTYEKMTESRIIGLCNELQIPGNLTAFMHRYYQTLPFVADERCVKAISRLLAEEMWKNTKIYVSVYGEDHLIKPVYNIDHPSPTLNTLHRLELQYTNESVLMNAISNGDLITIDQMLEGGKVIANNHKFTDSLRDKKNELIVFNTICRKAAEKGHIHPVYLEETFDKNIYEIERTTAIEELNKFSRRMVREYCLLVQSHSLKNYTQPIRQAINHIAFHLTDYRIP